MTVSHPIFPTSDFHGVFLSAINHQLLSAIPHQYPITFHPMLFAVIFHRPHTVFSPILNSRFSDFPIALRSSTSGLRSLVFTHSPLPIAFSMSYQPSAAFLIVHRHGEARFFYLIFTCRMCILPNCWPVDSPGNIQTEVIYPFLTLKFRS